MAIGIKILVYAVNSREDQELRAGLEHCEKIRTLTYPVPRWGDSCNEKVQHRADSGRIQKRERRSGGVDGGGRRW